VEKGVGYGIAAFSRVSKEPEVMLEAGTQLEVLTNNARVWESSGGAEIREKMDPRDVNMFATIVDSATGRREDCCRGALRSEAHTVAHVKTGQKEKVKTCLEDLHDFEGASGWLVQVTVEVRLTASFHDSTLYNVEVDKWISVTITNWSNQDSCEAK
jgi:hypothetical protein